MSLQERKYTCYTVPQNNSLLKTNISDKTVNVSYRCHFVLLWAKREPVNFVRTTLSGKIDYLSCNSSATGCLLSQCVNAVVRHAKTGIRLRQQRLWAPHSSKSTVGDMGVFAMPQARKWRSAGPLRQGLVSRCYFSVFTLLTVVRSFLVLCCDVWLWHGIFNDFTTLQRRKI